VAELTSYFTSGKIQDGGIRHFESWFNGYISIAMAYFTQALKYILHKQFCCQNSIPAKSKMAAAAILKFTSLATTRLLLNVFAQNLA